MKVALLDVSMILLPVPVPRRFIFDHDNTVRVLWDIYILVVLIYVLILAPYRIGFDDPAIGFAFFFELSLDFCYILDIFIQFRTTFVDENGRKELGWVKIGTRFPSLSPSDFQAPCTFRRQGCETHALYVPGRYLGGFFLIDVVSSVPWDLVLPNNGSSGDGSRLLKTVRLVKLTKLGAVKARGCPFASNMRMLTTVTTSPEEASVTSSRVTTVSIGRRARVFDRRGLQQPRAELVITSSHSRQHKC